MITVFDSLNIGFYFAFIVGVGLYFARKSKDTSDYFRGGGVLPWWITGTSAWMAGFSAWTFTGAAAKIYETGHLRARALLFQYHPAGGVAARRLLPLPPIAGHHSAGGPAAAFRAGRAATLHVVAPADHDDFRRLWL
jgi:Na+/proline symporter